MDPRRVPRAASDPKVRHVGFFAPGNAPDRTQSGPPEPASSSPPVSNMSPSSNSLSPVMIPPPRLLSADLSRRFPHGTHLSHLHATRAADYSSIPIGSYNPSEFISPTATTEFSEDLMSPKRSLRSGSGKFATSLPAGGFEMAAVKQKSVVNMAPDVIDGETKPASGKTLKEKTTKAERRAIQEAQRAKKASYKGGGGKHLQRHLGSILQMLIRL